MARFPGSVTSRFYRQGTAYAVGAIVDGFISGEETKVLYEKWNEVLGGAAPVSRRGESHHLPDDPGRPGC